MQREEDLLVIARRIVTRFDEQKSVLTSVLAPVQILAGRNVGVIPAEARGARGKRVASAAASLDQRRTFFHGAIHRRGQEEAVPVNYFGSTALIGHIDGDGLAFFEPQQRARHLAVIRNCLDRSVGGNFKLIGRDVDGVISRGDLLGAQVQGRASDGQAGKLEHLSACYQASS